MYLNLSEDGDEDSLPSRFLYMPNEMGNNGEAASNKEAKANEICSNLRSETTTVVTSSSESDVDIAKILDPFEQLERECNGEAMVDLLEYCVMSGDSGSEEMKVIRSDSDEGVVADDDGGDVVLDR